MAYTAKTDWKSNDIVKEDDFNRIEKGVGDLYSGEAISDTTEITTVAETDVVSIFRTVNSAVVRYKAKLSSLIALLEKTFAKTVTYTATVQSSSWTGSSAPYTVNVPVSGIKATDNPLIDLVTSSTVDTATEETRNWGYVYKIETNADSIKLYASDKPAVNLSLQLKVVR
jgi:hypothetical protein